MISYEPLWETMRQQRVTTYALINKYGIPASTIHSLKHDHNITMYTLEKLCNVLGCTADSVVKFVQDDTESTSSNVSCQGTPDKPQKHE